MKKSDKARKPGRKKPAPRKKDSAQPSRSSKFWRIALRLALLGLILLAGWMVYLDAVVTSRFEGRRFEVPSRVYARPLELYSGAPISTAALEKELALSGFHKVSRVDLIAGGLPQRHIYLLAGQPRGIHKRIRGGKLCQWITAAKLCTWNGAARCAGRCDHRCCDGTL